MEATSVEKYALDTSILEGRSKIATEPSLQAKQPQLSEPVFKREVLKPPDHLRGPLLDPLEHVHVCLYAGVPELYSSTLGEVSWK